MIMGWQGAVGTPCLQDEPVTTISSYVIV